MATEAAKQQASMRQLQPGGAGREIGSVDEVQKRKLAIAIQKTNEAEGLAEMQRLEYEEKLKAVVVKKEDIDVLAKELDLTKQKSERVLREHGGSLEAVFTAVLA